MLVSNRQACKTNRFKNLGGPMSKRKHNNNNININRLIFVLFQMV